MKVSNQLLIAKILIFSSFLLLSSGTLLYIKNYQDISNPKNSTVINKLDDNKITLTPIDDNKTITSEQEDNIIINEEITNQKKETTPKSIDEINQDIRQEIESKYGITVKYGLETNGYKVAGLTSNYIADPNISNTALLNLYGILNQYPENFFLEIKKANIPLTVYLIKNYSTNNITGITDSTYTKATISIAVDYPFAESFNHEIYHYIERYISKMGGKYSSWSSLNPLDFNYGFINNENSYNLTFNDMSYFVNNYAQTDPAEDRASTFEYMMASNKSSCLNKNMPIWHKAKYISEMIDLFFTSVSPSIIEYWERFL